MTTTEKAEAYIEPFKTHLLGCETDLMREAYIAGANEALADLWHTVNEIPPATTLLLCECRMESVATALCVYIRGRYMIYDGTFRYNKEFLPTHWMRIPKIEGGSDV